MQNGRKQAEIATGPWNFPTYEILQQNATTKEKTSEIAIMWAWFDFSGSQM